MSKSKPTVSKSPLFGQRLEQLRRTAGKTQDALGQEIDGHQPQISRFEKGDAQPTPEQIRKLADIFGVSAYTLVGGTELASEVVGDGLVTTRRDDAPVRWVLYFASGLTGLKAEERAALFADAAALREVCETRAAYLYEPRYYTDPVEMPLIPPEQVYATDRQQVSHSHVVVLHTRYRSFGAGQEIEIALAAGVPILALIDRCAKPSRMVLGTYARLHEVHFETEAELRSGFDAKLTTVLAELASLKELDRKEQGQAARDLGQRVARERRTMNYDHTLVARHVGISEAALRHLEDGQFNNISVTTVRRLAKTLRVSMSMLLEGVAPHPEDVEKHIGESLDNLRKFAHDKNLPYREFEALHSGFQDQYKRGRVAVVEARSDAVSVREWNERHEALKAGRPYAVPAQRTLALDED